MSPVQSGERSITSLPAYFYLQSATKSVYAVMALSRSSPTYIRDSSSTGQSLQPQHAHIANGDDHLNDNLTDTRQARILKSGKKPEIKILIFMFGV